MLDAYLPEYLKTIVTLRKNGNSDGATRTSVINSATGSRIYRARVPQSTPYPYIVVGQGFDLDYGITANKNLLREVGEFNVVIVGRDFASIDQIYRDVIDAMKMVRNQYLPSQSAATRIWCQCIILKNGEQFDTSGLDGSEQRVVGYIIPIRSGYDP